jgi:hypothetical protein
MDNSLISYSNLLVECLAYPLPGQLVPNSLRGYLLSPPLKKGVGHKLKSEEIIEEETRLDPVIDNSSRFVNDFFYGDACNDWWIR